jgi:hypothetical protein
MLEHDIELPAIYADNQDNNNFRRFDATVFTDHKA